MKHSLKHLSIMLLCLTVLLAMAACSQTDVEDGTTMDSIELSNIEEYKVQTGNTVEQDMRRYMTRYGPQSYYGVIDGHFLTKKGQVFMFAIRDKSLSNGAIRAYQEDYVPALFVIAAISKGDTIYVMDFAESNNQKALLEFAAEYIDANYDLEE